MQKGGDAQRGHEESSAGWKSEAAGSLLKGIQEETCHQQWETEQIHREKRAPGDRASDRQSRPPARQGSRRGPGHQHPFCTHGLLGT